MTEMTPRDHATRIAILDVIADEVTAASKAARKDGEAVFGPARADGTSQLHALLPDGSDIGLLSVKAGGKQVTVSEDALEGWVREHLADGIEECVDSQALTNAEVLDVLKAVFPNLVKTRIRTATRAALLKEIEKSGGWLTDGQTGEKEKIAEVTDLKPSGAFSFRPAADARQRVTEAWRRGELQDIALGALALPAADAAAADV